MSEDEGATDGTLPQMLSLAWDCLLRGLADRGAPARHPTCATTGPDGWPEARTLVLRAADREGARIDLHTDLRSAKIADLRAAPRLALHVWDPGPRLQIRLRCSAEVLTLGDPAAAAGAAPAGDAELQANRAAPARGRAEAGVTATEEVGALWARVPPASRDGYGSVPPPGTPVPGPRAYERVPDPARFAVLRCHVLAIDALHLGAAHRRARFDRADGWAGQWLAP